MEKERYIYPETELILFKTEDIITDSNELPEAPIIPW